MNFVLAVSRIDGQHPIKIAIWVSYKLVEAVVERRHVSEFLNHFLLGRQAYNGKKYHVLAYSASASYCVPFRSSVFRHAMLSIFSPVALLCFSTGSIGYRANRVYLLAVWRHFYVYVYIWLVCDFKQYLFVYFLYLSYQIRPFLLNLLRRRIQWEISYVCKCISVPSDSKTNVANLQYGIWLNPK